MNYRNELYEAVSNVDFLTESSESYLEYITNRLNSLYSESGISVSLSGDEIHLDFQNVDLYDLSRCLEWFFTYRDDAEERIENIGNYSGDFEVRGSDTGLVMVAKKF